MASCLAAFQSCLIYAFTPRDTSAKGQVVVFYVLTAAYLVCLNSMLDLFQPQDIMVIVSVIGIITCVSNISHQPACPLISIGQGNSISSRSSDAGPSQLMLTPYQLAHQTWSYVERIVWGTDELLSADTRVSSRT